MTSREIADLTGKRHPDVKRDIESMLSDLEEDVSKFARIYSDTMNREQTEYDTLAKSGRPAASDLRNAPQLGDACSS